MREQLRKGDAASYAWFGACAEPVTFDVGAVVAGRSELAHTGGNTPHPVDRAARYALALRAILQLLQSSKMSVSLAEKVCRSAVFIPVYAMLVLMLRARTWMGRMIPLLGRTSFGAVLPCLVPDIIGTYIWVFQEWEPDLTRFIASRVGPGDVFVDVGANIGYYALLTARSSRARTVAVEASPAMFDELRRNVAADEFGDRVRLVNKAAAAEQAVPTVYDREASSLGMTTLATLGLNIESKVESMRLDQMLTPAEVASIRLIKIDVQGSEPDVLAGMSTLAGSLRPDAEIVVDLWPQCWPDAQLRPFDVLQPFMQAGYNVYELKNSDTAWRYLWPNAVSEAMRIRDDLTERVSRLKVVLSRYDGDYLPIMPVDRYAATRAYRGTHHVGPPC